MTESDGMKIGKSDGNRDGRSGLTIKRHFTKSGEDPYDGFQYEKRNSIIKNPDGSIVFEIRDVEVPEKWSQLATDILAQKYIRKRGVPQIDENGEVKRGADGKVLLGGEKSIKQVVHRIVGTWRYWGEKYGYFSTEEDAKVFYDELVYMMLTQRLAPNSPQWFNTGLAWAYNILGEPQGHFYADPETGEVRMSEDAYSHPAPHACFIQSLKDDLVNPGGIFDLAVREARIFKYGSGTGTNFSALRGRGESLSGGGTSSGLMSFLKIFDAGAGAIKSGGTTRRAAKMVCLDMDHPEIETFIMWKYREEQKVADLVAGSKITKKALTKVAEATKEGTDWNTNQSLKSAIREAKRLGVSLNYIFRIIQLAEQGIYDPDFKEFDTHYESEAYQTVAGQHANNSVRIPNSFFEAVEKDGDWNLINRTDSNVFKSVKARDLWKKVCIAAWHSADPGVQYDTTINEWHTCPEDGRINASNPCSEYMFLDDTACNLASLNVAKFLDQEGELDIDGFRYATRLMTIALEISVLMAQFPSEPMARLSYRFRSLGLGYANIGSALMRRGVSYDSKEAQGFIGGVSAIMTGQSYATSAELAMHLGEFEGYAQNKEHMLRVIRNHRRAAYNAPAEEYEGLTITPQGIDPKYAPDTIVKAARECWDEALSLGEKQGYRNAQVTVLAPTGTIGLIMDCDTTGIEPDFALVKFKKLAGGGYFKIINQSVPTALKKLGYTEEESDRIIKYAVGHNTLSGIESGVTLDALREKGFDDVMLTKIEKGLPSAFDISFVFNRFTLGDSALEKLGFSKDDYMSDSFNLLSSLGFSKEEVNSANEYVCGTMTVEGAPGLKEEHLPVFDCASRCGKNGKRYLRAEAHISAMAAAQPFISGAISKTINMPNEATIDDIGKAYMLSWKLMVKANAIYRDGSKLSQPLNTVSEDLSRFDEDEIDETVVTPEAVQHGIATLHPGTPEWEGINRSATIIGKPVQVITSEYKDGTLGGVELNMEEESEEYRGLLSAYSQLLTFALEHQIPLNELIDKFTFLNFPPGGPVASDPAIKNATSPIDYLYRVLGHEYLGRQDIVHIKDALPTRSGRNSRSQEKGQEIYQEGEGERGKGALPARKKIVKELSDEEKLIAEAKAKGYTGDRCPSCGSLRLKRNGTCAICEDCGSTTGCS